MAKSKDRALGRPRHICMHVRNLGRTDQRVMREARALVDAGYEVTLVDIEKDTSRPKHEDIDGVHLRHIMMPSRFKPSRFKPMFLVKLLRTYRLAIREMRRVNADAYHSQDFDALFATYAVARRLGKPLVYDAHELPLVDPYLTRWRRLHKMASGRLRRMMSECSAVITVSPPIVDDLQRLYGGPPAMVVRNMPNYQPPILGSNRLREAMGLPDSARIALYQGALQANRSLHLLVDAAPYLASDNIIAMLGYGAMQEQLKQMVADRHLEDRVKILPRVPYEELLTWTASADLGLVIVDPNYSPSIHYGLPNKLYEYLMTGLPVLSSDLPAISQTLERYQVGAVVRGLEPQAIAHAINSMLNDGPALALMRQNALNASRTHLNWETEQRTLINIYDNLFTPSPAHPMPTPAAK